MDITLTPCADGCYDVAIHMRHVKPRLSANASKFYFSAYQGLAHQSAFCGGRLRPLNAVVKLFAKVPPKDRSKVLMIPDRFLRHD